MSWTAQQTTDFAVPCYIFEGEADEHTLTSLAQEYFAQVRAPRKELALLPGGHCAVLMHPAAFLGELRAHLCPLTPATTP